MGRKKGYKHSEVTIQMISNNRKGIPAWNKGISSGFANHPENINKISYNKGKKCSWVKNPIMKGKDNPNWKGGVTKENHRIRSLIEFRLWRESVFVRDNWTCQMCQIRGGIIHAHHVKEFSKFPELRYAINNGLTLCKKCHKKIHSSAQVQAT